MSEERLMAIRGALSSWYAALDRGVTLPLPPEFREVALAYERLAALAGQEPFGPKVDEAVKRSCAELSLAEALSWIAVWETERVVRQAARNILSGERTHVGGLWETMFQHCFSLVLDAYPKGTPRNDPVTAGIRTIRTIKPAGKWVEIWSEEALRSDGRFDLCVKGWRLDEVVEANGMSAHILNHGYAGLRLKVGTDQELIAAGYPAGHERPGLLVAERAARAVLEAEVVMLCGECNDDGPCYPHAVMLGGRPMAVEPTP